MSKFIDTIKHAIIEDDPDPKSSTTSQPHPDAKASAASPAPPTVSDVASFHTTSGESEQIYKRILAKTDFQATPVAATIRKYLDPLSAISSMDERTKFKTAVVQAKAQEGLTEEKILATFDGLKVALQNEQESFKATAQATKEHEITDRQSKVQEITNAIAGKQKEISQLQQRLSQMSADLVEAQNKIQHAEAQFTSAAQRRAAEIDQEKAKYNGLLRG